MRFAARVDETQAGVVGRFRALGYSVLILSRVGDDCPDLLCGGQALDFLAEVKTPGRGKLSKGQKQFIETWKGLRPVVVWDPLDVDDLDAHIRARRTTAGWKSGREKKIVKKLA